MSTAGDPAGLDLEALVDVLAELDEAGRAAWFAAHPEAAPVRPRLERLLQRIDELVADEDALPDLVAPMRGAPAAEAQHPESIGPYRIEGLLGSGGMGIVYLAEQKEPRRRVALKVLRGGILAEEVRLRFEREAELLARLAHPGIAQVIESGRAEGGESYLVLEWIDGLRLNDHAEAHDLSREQRLTLLAELGDAVHHAHLRGVVHRDLKPANVLVTAEGQVKVIDFGVARALDSDGLATLETRAGQVIGTLAYMAPEQVRGDSDAIDARADVYALGVLAYELLGGRLPHDLTTTSVPEAARVLADVDPPTLGHVSRACRGDLEVVVGKAIAKEPERRYASAAAFAADLRRVLAGEAVLARRPTLTYQVRKLARRHRGAFLGAAAALLALVVGAGLAFQQALEKADLARRESLARSEAETQAALARQASERAADEARSALAARAEAEHQADLAQDARELAESRADVLERITTVQTNLLRSIQPGQIAPPVRAAMLDAFTALLARETGRAGVALDQDRAAFAAALDRADLSGALLAGLDIGFFQPVVFQLAGQLADAPAAQARLLRGVADAEASLGLVDGALEHYAVARELMLEADGGESPRSLALLVDLAVQLLRAGRQDEATTLLRAHQTALDEQLRPYKEYTRVMRLFAYEDRLRGDLDGAIRRYQEAVAASERPPVHLPPTLQGEVVTVDLDGLALRSDLGSALCERGDLEEGLAQLEIARAEIAAVAAVAELPLAVAAQSLQLDILSSRTLCDLGQGDQGEARLRLAVQQGTRLLGAEHPLTLAARGHLGQWLLHTERGEEAADHLEAAQRGLPAPGG